MSWNAKPSGGYALDSAEYIANIQEIDAYFTSEGFSHEAISAICGNIEAEGGMNPWRYQGDVSSGAGYGLFQYTPKSGYLNKESMGWPQYAPNYAGPSGTSASAAASDGYAQIYVFRTDALSKWVSSCWRTYWSASAYPTEYALRTTILNRWGNGSSLTMDQFSQINDIRSATFAFLACFEGPAAINLDDRVRYAENASQYITGRTTIPPWLLFKFNRR